MPRVIRRRLLRGIGVAALALACQDSTGPQSPPRQVVVTPSFLYLVVGTSEQLVATVTNVAAATGVLGLRLSPDGAHVYAGRLSGGEVRVIDRATWTVVRTIAVPAPRRIAFDRLGTVAAIADQSGAVVIVQ